MKSQMITISGTDSCDSALKRYLNDIRHISPLNPDEESELVERIKEGDLLALERLVTANLRFVVTMAKRYRHSNISLCDLISEGNIGLMEAAKRFDNSAGFKFLSYAGWYIRKYISDAAAEYSGIVHLPRNQFDAIMKMNRASIKLEQQLSRSPSEEELAAFLGTSTGKVTEAFLNTRNDISIHDAVSSGSETALIDVLPCGELADSNLMHESVSEDVKRCISFLPKKECEVLMLFFGIGQDKALTLEEISEKFLVSRERVRQLKEKSIRQLQRASHAFTFLSA